jgi:hypothetical protein
VPTVYVPHQLLVFELNRALLMNEDIKGSDHANRPFTFEYGDMPNSAPQHLLKQTV